MVNFIVEPTFVNIVVREQVYVELVGSPKSLLHEMRVEIYFGLRASKVTI